MFQLSHVRIITWLLLCFSVNLHPHVALHLLNYGFEVLNNVLFFKDFCFYVSVSLDWKVAYHTLDVSN